MDMQPMISASEICIDCSTVSHLIIEFTIYIKGKDMDMERGSSLLHVL